jgi:hypothetical protein
LLLITFGNSSKLIKINSLSSFKEVGTFSSMIAIFSFLTGFGIITKSLRLFCLMFQFNEKDNSKFFEDSKLLSFKIATASDNS